MRQSVARAPTLLLSAAVLLLSACGDNNPLGVNPGLAEGRGRIWEVSAADLPSGFDVVAGRRLFLGNGDVGSALGDFFLDGPRGSTDLRLRSIASLLTVEVTHSVGLQDLGAVDFTALDRVPNDGYTESEDSTGVAAVAGHVYALRTRRSTLGDNFAKLVVDSISTTSGDPDRQFIDFRYTAQVQPGNTRFESN